MPNADEVADKARSISEKGVDFGVGYCLKFSRTCAGAPAKAYNAITAWRQAQHRHSVGVPPRGALVFWSGGGAGHGHVAVSEGRGYVWSTDIRRPGRVDRYGIAALGVRWPNLRYLGWAEDVNGVRVSGLDGAAVTSAKGQVALSNLRPGLKNSDVTELQAALRRHGQGKLNPSGATGYFGTETRAMVRAFQEAQGWKGTDADGIPGPKTAALLGLRVA